MPFMSWETSTDFSSPGETTRITGNIIVNKTYRPDKWQQNGLRKQVCQSEWITGHCFHRRSSSHQIGLFA
jgi:hypothetical protein